MRREWGGDTPPLSLRTDRTRLDPNRYQTIFGLCATRCAYTGLCAYAYTGGLLMCICVWKPPASYGTTLGMGGSWRPRRLAYLITSSFPTGHATRHALEQGCSHHPRVITSSKPKRRGARWGSCHATEYSIRILVGVKAETARAVVTL